MHKAFGIAGAVAVAALLGSATAWGHAFISSPPARFAGCQNSGPDCKAGPCGGRDKGTPKLAVSKTGQITVEYDETIDHRGCYVIELSRNGLDTNFEVLATINDPANAVPMKRTHTIQLDGGVECENCTLRLLQVMSGTTGDCTKTATNTYFSCADIKIGDDASVPDSGPTPGPEDMEDSGTNGGGSGDAGRTDASSGGGNEYEDDFIPSNDGGGCSTLPGEAPYGGVAGLVLAAGAWFASRRRPRR